MSSHSSLVGAASGLAFGQATPGDHVHARRIAARGSAWEQASDSSGLGAEGEPASDDAGAGSGEPKVAPRRSQAAVAVSASDMASERA
eukprot:CAMPEP_0195149156 /NCGR_PEP_ID=MMETSP0448-20130528/176575_1 /TAXON_ID=66468 /ORGANISM="Heterocapsa triquestra, Strain CCMP 448" /LENGTH=87 /DNA_ID=CAMNT_0040187793 /DNA_START=239 /DNA_END=499 /DNA_ORIENTATION=-